MIYVIAGCKEEARGWMRSWGLVSGRDAEYVARSEQLFGIPRGSTFVRVGRWHGRSDIVGIEKFLATCVAVEISPHSCPQSSKKDYP